MKTDGRRNVTFLKNDKFKHDKCGRDKPEKNWKKKQLFTVIHHQMKHLKVGQKYSAARRIFNSFLGVSSGDETRRLMRAWYIT